MPKSNQKIHKIKIVIKFEKKNADDNFSALKIVFLAPKNVFFTEAK